MCSWLWLKAIMEYLVYESKYFIYASGQILILVLVHPEY